MTDTLSSYGAPRGEFRDKLNVPAGLQHYSNWFIPSANMEERRVTPSDYDFHLHNKQFGGKGGIFLFGEFKPHINAISAGQETSLRSLTDLSKNITTFVASDPYWDKRTFEKYDQESIIDVMVFRDGARMTFAGHTLGWLNTAIQQWWFEQGEFFFDRLTP